MARKARGSGRVAFIARLDAIKAEIARGDYLVTIHERHAKALGGITYSAFRKLVQRYAEDAKPARPRPYGTASRPEVQQTATHPSPSLELRPSPSRPAASPKPQGPADARHEPARPRTFVYDGNPSPDDDALIFGRRKPDR